MTRCKTVTLETQPPPAVPDANPLDNVLTQLVASDDPLIAEWAAALQAGNGDAAERTDAAAEHHAAVGR